MKKLFFLFITPLLLCGCKPQGIFDQGIPEPLEVFDDYGAFLGRSDNDVTNFSKYNFVSCELDEFSDTNIARLKSKNTHLLAYLNVGALENYRDYYEDYESFTFKDYDNWPDERWIDVSNTSWQNFVVNTLAQGFKDRQAFGVYLDNVDVYTIAKKEGKDYNAFALGLKNIIKGISDLGLFVMINGGAEFLDDMNDQEDQIFNSIWAYHQEEVFSLITDYEHDGFGTQNQEDTEYYQEIAAMMKEKGKQVFFLEYTTDNSLIGTIIIYCDLHKYHHYISNNVDLK